MRRKRLRFYGELIMPGDLVFDVGANVGERSEVFLALGASVVAVEPQTECTERLRARWADHPHFTLVEGACAEAVGEGELFVSDVSTLSTMSRDWIEAVSQNGVFSEYRWEERRTVTTTTLDVLTAEYGVPRFVKIDVEGFEHVVLAGLSQPVGCASVEWQRMSLDATARCIDHLAQIGMAEFNVSLGESMAWELPRWVDAATALDVLRARDKLEWGDLYARAPAPGPMA